MNTCVKFLLSGVVVVFTSTKLSATNTSLLFSKNVVVDSLIKRMPTDSLIAIQNRKLSATEKKLKDNNVQLQQLKDLNTQKIKELKAIEKEKTSNSKEYKAKVEEIMVLGDKVDRLSKYPNLPEIGGGFNLDDVKILNGFDWEKLGGKARDLLNGMDFKLFELDSLEDLFKGKKWEDITLGDAKDKAADLADKLKKKMEDSQKVIKKDKPKLSEKDQKKLDALNKEQEELDKKRQEILKKKAEILQPNVEKYMDVGGKIIKSWGDQLKEK